MRQGDNPKGVQSDLRTLFFWGLEKEEGEGGALRQAAWGWSVGAAGWEENRATHPLHTGFASRHQGVVPRCPPTRYLLLQLPIVP